MICEDPDLRSNASTFVTFYYPPQNRLKTLSVEQKLKTLPSRTKRDRTTDVAEP